MREGGVWCREGEVLLRRYYKSNYRVMFQVKCVPLKWDPSKIVLNRFRRIRLIERIWVCLRIYLVDGWYLGGEVRR